MKHTGFGENIHVANWLCVLSHECVFMFCEDIPSVKG